MIVGPMIVALATAPQPSAYEATAAAVERGNAALRKRAWVDAIAAYDEAQRESAELTPVMEQRVGWTIALNRAHAALGLARSEGRTGPLQASAKELAALPTDDAPEATRAQLDAARHEVEAELAKEHSATRAKGLAPLTVAGIVVCASAAAAVAVMAAGFVVGARAEDDFLAGPGRAERDAADEAGSRGNAMAFGGGLSAGILLSVGASLIVLGRRIDVKDKAGATASLSATGLSVRF